mgnify:CR=1 FL=1
MLMIVQNNRFKVCFVSTRAALLCFTGYVMWSSHLITGQCRNCSSPNSIKSRQYQHSYHIICLQRWFFVCTANWIKLCTSLVDHCASISCAEDKNGTYLKKGSSIIWKSLNWIVILYEYSYHIYICNWHKITWIVWTWSWSRGFLKRMFINVRFNSHFLAITSLRTLKSTKLVLEWTCFKLSVVWKIRVLDYTPEMFHCGPTWPCGLIQLWAIHCNRNSNSTEATYWIGLFIPSKAICGQSICKFANNNQMYDC